MENNVLAQFFGKLLPLFPPRTEAALKNMRPSDLQRVNFRYIFTVQGMTEISHLIEDTVIGTPGIGDVHVSFQYFSRLADQQARYEQVAQASKGLWLYGVPDAPLPELSRLTAVDTSGTPLERYWFVLAYGPGLHMALLAEEITPENPLPGEPRMYEGFYTFDKDFTFKAISVLHMIFPQQVGAPTPPELWD